MKEPQRPSVFRARINILLRFVLLFFCTSMLTSCGMVGGLLNYLISLPFKVFNAVCP